jgi:hypothetical protein
LFEQISWRLRWMVLFLGSGCQGRWQAVEVQSSAHVLRDAAAAYKVDMEAIGLQVRQEFAARGKTRTAKKPNKKGSNRNSGNSTPLEFVSP